MRWYFQGRGSIAILTLSFSFFAVISFRATPSPERQSCQMCDFTTNSTKRLERHIECHFKDLKFTCWCSFSVADARGLKHHLKNHHKSAEPRVPPPVEYHPDSPETPPGAFDVPARIWRDLDWEDLGGGDPAESE